MPDKFRTLYKGLFLTCLLMASSCATVAPWDRALLDDPLMQSDIHSCSHYEQSALSHREGASGASGYTTAGGCGCQ